MKLLLVISLATTVLCDSDYHVTNRWQRMKAMESCWGEENMKLYTVNIKRAIAKCNHEEAPELSLPPYRSSYRFVNTILKGADKMESEQENMYEKMMEMMEEYSRNSRPSYRPYSTDYQRDNNRDNLMDKIKMRFMMKQMMENMMTDSESPMSYGQKDDEAFDEDMMKMFSTMYANKMEDKRDNFVVKKSGNYNTDSYRKNDPMARMSQLMEMFSNHRSRRAAVKARDGLTNPNLDLGDRLVEKLNEQKRFTEAKIGNMTCVMKEMNTLNSDNDLDIRAIKRDAEQYTMPSPWFAQRYEELIDTCYEMATNLPASIGENSVITGDNFGTVKLAEIKSFMKCCSKAKTQLCMNQDIKKKVESNFGPLEDILQQTQLTESQIFPLIMQLLHGQEMQYMMGEY